MRVRWKAKKKAVEPQAAYGTAHSIPQMTTSAQGASSESSCVDGHANKSILITPAAIDAAIHTPELLELILQHLSHRQLFATQRVCRAFHSTIGGSSSPQNKMLLRYPFTVSAEIDSRQEYDPPVASHAFWMSKIWAAGAIDSDYIHSLSGFGLGGSATEVRCLHINAACPLCERSLVRKPRFTKIRRALHSVRDPIPVPQSKALWRGIKLSRHKSCTVAVVLRPYTKNCDHNRTARRRLVEFPPGKGTLGDLDDCLRNYACFDKLDSEREARHFQNLKVATYVWTDGELRAQVRGAMNPVGLVAAQVQLNPYVRPFVCTLGTGH